MIKLPIRVSGELAERVEKSYADAIERVGEAEAIYVRSKLPKVVADLQRGTQDLASRNGGHGQGDLRRLGRRGDPG